MVHANPSQVNESLFADFATSSQIITSRIVTKLGGTDAARELVRQHYSGSAALAMRAALSAFGLDGTVYANLVERIARSSTQNDIDGVSLLVMAFIATGCLANPLRAADLVESFARQRIAAYSGTISTTVGDIAELPSAYASEEGLGLIRLIDGVARPPIYALSPTATGTLVGSLASGASAINDVDVDVSRTHLHIWKEGRQLVLPGRRIDQRHRPHFGRRQSIQQVEPPKRERRGADYPPVQLHAADQLCLGRTTRFLVVKIRG